MQHDTDIEPDDGIEPDDDVSPVPPEVRVADCTLSDHGWGRLTGRGFTKSMVERTIEWGRVQYSHGHVRMVVGNNEVSRAARAGVDLADCVGIHVVMGWDGEIVTVYRNRTLKRRDTAHRHRPGHRQ